MASEVLLLKDYTQQKNSTIQVGRVGRIRSTATEITRAVVSFVYCIHAGCLVMLITNGAEENVRHSGYFVLL